MGAGASPWGGEGQWFLTEASFEAAAGGGVRHKNLVGQGGDKFVAADGEVGGDAAFGLGKEGEDQQAAVGQGLFPSRGDTFREAPGGTDDDGWLAAQENAEAFLLDRRQREDGS